MSEKDDELETRAMNVTMSKEEFRKFDRGETYSRNGIRNGNGKFTSQPNISPLSENDIPVREVVRERQVLIEQKRKSFGEQLSDALIDGICDGIYNVITDPEIQKAALNKGKAIWKYKLKPKLNNVMKSVKTKEPDETKIEETKHESVKITKDNGEKIVVSKEQADQMEDTIRTKARELYAMILLYSKIQVKDDKTNTDKLIEQNYIKELLEEENQKSNEIIY